MSRSNCCNNIVFILFSHRKWWQKLFSRSPQPLPPASAPIKEYTSSPQLPRSPTVYAVNPLSPEIVDKPSSPPDNLSALPDNSSDDVSTHSIEGEGRHIPQDRKWATRWYWQFLVLIVRTFRESRHNFLSSLNLIQSLFLAIACALVWFQVLKVEENINDAFAFVS